MNTYSHVKHALDLIDNYDVFIFDLWGVIIEDDIVYPGVIETINNIAKTKEVLLISNAPIRREIVQEQLDAIGVNIKASHIFTAGEMAREMLCLPQYFLGTSHLKLFHIGQEHHKSLLHNIDVEITDDMRQANLLFLTMHCNADDENIEQYYDILKEAALRDTLALCVNPDIFALLKGNIRYCTGHFAKKYEDIGGRVIYSGKPYKDIFNIAISKCTTSINRGRTIMIGDTFGTDILGARRTGMDSGLVLTGNTSTITGDVDIATKLSKLEEYSKESGLWPTHVIRL